MESQQPVNPYAPPAVDSEQVAQDPNFAAINLASRWQRLGATLLDGLIGAIVGIPVYKEVFVNIGNRGGSSMNPFAPYMQAGMWGAVTALLTLGLMALQAVLITRRGQSIGKIALDTRIITLTGAGPGFVHGVLLRTWLPAAVALVPGIGGLLSVVDACFIFRSDKRTLHDLIAGTRVVRVSKPAS